MGKCIRRISPVVFALALYPCAAAPAAVNLALVDNSGPPNATTAGPNSSFTVSLKLTAGSEQVTGVDYFLKASTSNIFTITSRNSQTVGSAFPDVFSSDSSVAPAGLNPQNAINLGGTVSNPNVPVSNNTFEVADYTISVAANAPAGVYTITTVSNPNTGYEGPGPTFPDTPFDQHATYTVTVPEPATAALMGLGLVSLFARRRSLNKHDC